MARGERDGETTGDFSELAILFEFVERDTPSGSRRLPFFLGDLAALRLKSQAQRWPRCQPVMAETKGK